MGWAMLAITVIQMGMAQQQQEDQMQAANAAQANAERRSIENQSQLTAKLQRNRRRAQGATSDNQTFTSRQISGQGTILGKENQQNRSLLGG